jgi:hypothetical protein
LGWHLKTNLKELVKEMIDEDLQQAERDEFAKRHGYQSLNSFE